MTPELHTTESLHDPISTPPSGVESFSQAQMKIIQDKITNLTPENITVCQKHLDVIQKTTTPADQIHITNIIHTLLQTASPSESLTIPTILKTIRTQSSNITNTQKDIPWYINTLLGRAKTELAQASVQAPSGSGKELSEEEKLDQQLADTQQTLQTIDNSINNKKKIIVAKTAESQQLDKIIVAKKKKLEEITKDLEATKKIFKEFSDKN